MINSLLKPYKNFKNKCIAKYFSQFSFSQLCQRRALSLFDLTFGVVLRLIRASKAVNRRALSTLTATLVLFAFLTACSGGGGGGGGGSSDTPTPSVPSPSLSLAVSNSALTLSEDFSPALRVATATNATDIRVSQSTTGVVDVTTSGTGVSVSSILNASGRTTLTIVASNSSGSTTAQVVVTVNAVNDPPTLVVSSNSISTLGGFSPITINTTASDIEDANLTFTVTESTAGVVRVTQSANAIVLNNIPNASGQTTLTITAVDSSGTTVTQTISVNVTVTAGATPVLMVSNNRINVQEDFGSVVIRTTVTDSDSTTVSLAVTTSMRLVNVAISTRTNNLSTITLTAIANLNGTVTLTFHATDDGGQTNSTEIVVVVAAVNDTPTLTIPTATLTVLEDFDGTTSVATFADVDSGDALTVTVTESTTGIVTVTTSASGVSVAAIKNRNGRTTLNISVSDGTVSSTTQVVVDVTPVNDPPALSVSTSVLTLVEDFGAFLIATTRTDIDSTTLTLTVAESATGVVTVQTSTSGVSVSSIGQRSGRTTLTITLSDSQLSTTTQVVIDVTAVNDPPTISVSTTALTLNEDFATTQLITVNRSDIENDTLTLSVAESATGVVTVTTIDAGVQVVSIANANGQTTLTITVSDSNTSVSTQVVVTVNAVNDPPTLTVSSNSISTVGGFSAITINTTASDIEDDNISFSVINADTGVVRITTSTNAIMLNSMPGASGQTTLTVRVVDSSGAAVTEIITVSVSIMVSATPVVTVSTNLISLQEDFGTSIIIQTTATDADGDTITVSVSASMPIVTAVISTPASGQSTLTNSITLTAIDNANGTATLTVVASDTGGQSQSTEIVVVLSPVEDAPTINISSAILTVAEDFGSTQTIATASDADGDALDISVVQSTTGIVTVTTSASGVSVSSIGNANGQTTLTITVNDGNQDTTGQVVVNVTPVNDPPSLNIPSATLTRAENFVGGITVATASDVEGNPLTFTVTESTTGVIRVTATASEVRISSLGDANGMTTLVISVSDGDLTTTAQVVITVTPVNDPPTLSVTTTALTLNEDFAEVLIGTTRSDIDSNTLTLTVAESATGVVTVTITDAGVQVTNIRNANGVTTLTLSLSDGELTTTAQVVVTITPVNDPPSLSVSTTALTLNEDFATTEVITVNRNDIDSNTLTLTVSESATGVVTVTITDAGVQVTNISNANGATTLTLSLSDSELTTTAQVVVTVVPVNDTPTLSVSINNLSLNVDFSTITINTTAYDADEGALSFAVQASPTNVVTVTTSTNAIMLNAIAGASGQTTLTVRTTDNTGRTAVQTISVIVSPTPNSAPVLVVSTNRISVLEDFMSSVVIRTTATDADGDTITLSVSSTSRFVDVAISTPINGNSTITLSAINNANGQTTLTITVSDSQTSVSTQVVVTVNAVNDTPTLTVSSNSITTFGAFSTITINTTASDVEDGALTFTVSAVPTGVVTVTTSANAITLNAISNVLGQTTLTVRTADRSGTTVTRTISVNVINSAPVLTVSTSLISLQEDFTASVMFNITAMDIDGDTITLSVSSTTRLVDAALSTPISGQSTITLTAIDHENGTTTLTVQATAAGLSVSTEVVVVVAAVNDTPTLTVSSNSITTIGGFSTITINTTASDIEDSTLSFTVSAFPTGVVRVTTSANAILLNAISGATGQTTLTVRTADSLGTTVTQTIAVNVINSAPVLTVSTSLISVQEDFMTSIMFSITASDIDGDAITILVSSSSRVVNAALSTPINGQSTITLTAIDHENGTTTLTVQATAAGQSVSTNVVVVVVPVNDTPTLTVSSNSITTVGGFSTITINTTASDIEDSTLSFSVLAFPTGVVRVTTSANAITLNAISGATGQTTLTVRTADLSGTAVTQTIAVNVANSAPVLTVSTSLISLQEDFMTSIMFSITATDIDGDAITLSVSSSSRLVDTALSTPISGQSTITLTAIDHENGTTTLIVQATAAGQSVSTNVVVVVVPVNDTPTLSVSTDNISTNVDFSAITINTTANDVDEGALSFSVSVFPTGVVTVTTSANAITLNAISGVSGQTTLTVRTADRSGTTVTQTISVIVTPTPNSAPVLVVSTNLISVQEDFMASVMFSITASDIDGDAITLSVSSTTRLVDAALSTPINGQSTITLTAIDHENGTTTLTVQATAAGQSVSTNVVVVVVPVNDTPTLTVSSNSITTVGGFSTITINTTANDIEDRTLSFTVLAFPTGVVRVSTSANAITLNAISGATGQTTLTVRTADLSGTAITRTISVNVINSAPVLTVSTSLISVQEDFTTSVMFNITATDIDGDTITLSVSSTTRLGDVALSTLTNGVSTITLTAIDHENGTTTLTVQATAVGQSVSTNVVVVVVPVNDTPTLSVSTDNISTNVDFSTITINTTANDVDEGALSFSVSVFPTGVVTVTTSANAITLNAISGVSGQTTLTVRTADSLGTTVTQTISVIVSPTPNSAPVLVVSTNRISVQEDFNGSVVIRTTATDAEGDTITLSVSSTSRFVDVAISTPINGKSTITNSITLTAIKNANGTTTLTVQASDMGGQSAFTEIVVVVNAVDDPIPFSLSTSAVSFSVPGSQLDRILNAIRISNPDNKTLRAQIQVTTSGDNIFSVNPTPVASFTTNTLTTTTTLISAVSTAQLYFTIAPNSFGTATLVVQLTDLDTALMTQQTMIVSVNSPNVPPTIVPASSSITNLVVYGGHLYANDTIPPIVGISRYLTTARALGGHLINFNSVEEYNYIVRSAASGLTFAEAWLGLVLPQRTLNNGGGELSWITHDSTIAYGYATANGVGNLTVYPGHYNLKWEDTAGLIANRVRQDPNTVFNWTVHGTNGGVFFLVDDIGDGPRGVMYEFPQGLPTIASHSTSIRVVTNASVRLTGYDLNGDAINTNNWSITDPNGGSAVFNLVSQRSGAQTVDMVYTPQPNFDGQTTVAVTLQVNGLSTTYPISFIVDGVPSIALSTNTITLNEDFGTFDIGTTATDQGVSTSLPFWVSASASGIVTISTSANNIELSAVQHANGPVTLTVQTIDSASQSISSLIVVNVQAVNDTPTLTVSTNSISILGGVSIITIDTTATDVEDGPLSFSVQSSTTGMLSITTSANAIVLDTIYNASVQATLTVTVVDSSNTTVVQTIAVNVIITPSATPVLTVSTNLMRVNEDFSNPVVIRTTATDADGGALIISISSSSQLVNAVLSSPTNGVSTLTNSITLTSMTDLNGTTTLTVRATDGGGISSTEQIVVVVNPVDDAIPFTLSTSAVSLSVPGSQLDRIVQSININNPSNTTLSAQLQVTSSGDPIFSANPTPVVSFTTNALTTVTTLTSTMPTAQLYFTIAPNSTGTATLTVHLTNLATSDSTQQTLVVQVNPVDVPPAIVPTSSSITNFVVHGGRLYANDATASGIGISRFLTTASALGGHLANINSVEEYTFVRTAATSGLISKEAYFGLVLPQQDFPGELSWITHDSTIAYGYSSDNGIGNHTIYPGQYPLPWATGEAGVGLDAHRFGLVNTSSNWTIFSDAGGGVIYLVDDGGDGLGQGGNPVRNRNVVYEFPQGIAPTSINPISLNSGTNVNISLTGFDLNGDTISTNNWSITDPNGGSAIFNQTFRNTGVQTVTMTYTAPSNFSGQTTVAVTLGVNGLSSTYAISFMVDGPPTIALSTNAITLAEDFSNFVIGTTVTDQGVSGNQPFSVQTISTGIMNLSTTINSIQFSGALNFFGTVTLTVQATDSTAQTASTLVVVTVQAVNDTPTVTVSTDNISILGGFSPITIDTTATDIEQGVLPFSVQASPQGVVSISTSSNAIVLSPMVGGSGRTTLTVSAIDDGSKTGIQTIAVNVMVTTSTSTPVLSVSTNLISLQEEFGSVVIGTTATDVENGTLVVTVSSTTHLVNMVISTHSITLSSVANLFGTTTLTVRASDTDGVFVSTELVVIVASVNDTPTLSVSSNTVILNSASLMLDVTASDVEDGVLSFGSSSGQGYVDIAITTTRLTLTRLNQSGQLLLTLTSTDTDGGTGSTVVRVTIPTFFDVTTGIKTLDFSWSAVSTATHYQLQSNPDGNSGFTDLSTTGIVVSPNSTDIKQTTAQGLVSLHRYIPNVTNPQYGVKTCDATSCGTSFRHNTVSLTNAQLNGMIGRLQANNSDSEDYFGFSVDLSGDGNTLAVGAYLEDASSTGVNGVQNNNSSATGAVYLYRRMGGAWSQQAYIKASNAGSNDQFGWSVRLNDDGNTLAVGATREDGSATGVNGAQNDNTNDSGAVYVFHFSSSTWSQQAYIKASNTDSDDRFGYTVALSGNGNTLAVGVPDEDSRSRGVNSNQNNNGSGLGATYLFRFNGGMWSQQAYIKASNPSLFEDRFGQSVSLNKDGNTLAVGAYFEDGSSTGVNGAQNFSDGSTDDSGAVYVFRFSSSTWSQQAYIKALNVFTATQFGWSVDLNDDGNTLAVGANQDRSNSTGVNGAQNAAVPVNSGAAYVFRFSSSTWSQQAFIKASNTGRDNFFGYSVSISGDGNALVVGEHLEDGSATGVEGTNNGTSTNSGAAYVFEFANGTWAQQAFIKASDTSPNARFGESVSISSDGGAIAVGARGVNTNTGAVYLY